MTFPLKALLACGALAFTSGAALAASATATTQLNVRSGPGTTYGVVDTLPAGETVNVLGCGSTWCEISMGGDGTGFVAETYLAHRGGGGPVRQSVVVEEEPEIVGLSIGGYWDNRPYYIRDGYYYWGGRWYGDRPGRSGWRDRSWRRWEERREARSDWRRERGEDRRDRFEDRRDRRDDNRDRRQDAREDRRDDRRDNNPGFFNENRGGSRESARDARREQRVEQRTEQRQQRLEPREPRSSSPRDGGDRVGLDRSGGGKSGGRSD